MHPCGLFCVPKAHSTTSQNPAAIAITAACIMPIAVAPPMSIVAQKTGVMPRYEATREAQPCCSPIMVGMRTRTPSMSSRETPQSSMARLEASRVKPIELTPGSLPKRDSPMPATALRSRRRAASPMAQCERGGAHDLSLALLVLGPQLAVDAARAVLVPHGGHAAAAGDHVARPGELREAGPHLPHRRRAAGLHEELGEIPHRQHAVREDPGIAGVTREVVVG